MKNGCRRFECIADGKRATNQQQCLQGIEDAPAAGVSASNCQVCELKGSVASDGEQKWECLPRTRRYSQYWNWECRDKGGLLTWTKNRQFRFAEVASMQRTSIKDPVDEEAKAFMTGLTMPKVGDVEDAFLDLNACAIAYFYKLRHGATSKNMQKDLSSEMVKKGVKTRGSSGWMTHLFDQYKESRPGVQPALIGFDFDYLMDRANQYHHAFQKKEWNEAAANAAKRGFSLTGAVAEPATSIFPLMSACRDVEENGKPANPLFDAAYNVAVDHEYWYTDTGPDGRLEWLYTMFIGGDDSAHMKGDAKADLIKKYSVGSALFVVQNAVLDYAGSASVEICLKIAQKGVKESVTCSTALSSTKTFSEKDLKAMTFAGVSSRLTASLIIKKVGYLSTKEVANCDLPDLSSKPTITLICAQEPDSDAEPHPVKVTMTLTRTNLFNAK